MKLGWALGMMLAVVMAEVVVLLVVGEQVLVVQLVQCNAACKTPSLCPSFNTPFKPRAKVLLNRDAVSVVHWINRQSMTHKNKPTVSVI